MQIRRAVGLAVTRKDEVLVNLSGLPLAGGVPEDFVRKAIKLGVAKINTDSDLRLAALGRLRQLLAERPALFNMYELMGEFEIAIEEVTVARIGLLGSSGRAGS